MKHIDIKNIFADKSYIGQSVTVCGWVRTSRNSKTMAFIALNDGTSLNHLQIVIDKSTDISFEDELPTGTYIKVTGTLVEDQHGSVEINAEEISVIV
ncbi:MAG: asparagine--tRNA ligase, partial [Oscillospiraceae bacterium]|nr:asparagine--tRNA ligase [Oscillospiraceae bacterium]